MPDPTIPSVGLADLHIADVSSHWEGIGFHVFCGTCVVGRTRLTFKAQGSQVAAWGLSGTNEVDLIEQREHITTFAAEHTTETGARHPNQTSHIDHVVLNTPNMPRTLRTFEEAGLNLRRIREASPEIHQAFYRLGEVILEVVGHPTIQADEPAALWGLICEVPDLEFTATIVGEQLGPIRNAVQPGRNIATLVRSSPIRVPLGFIAESKLA